MRRRSCLALPAALLPCLAGAAADEPLLLGITENLPPLNFADESGAAQGFSVDLLRLMTALAGTRLAMQVLPWQRAMQVAEATPQSILFSLTRLPEREAQYQWVGPIAQRRILLFRLARRTDLTLSQLSDLGGARIGVVRDSAADRQLQAAGLKPGVQLEQGLDDATNVRKLLAGRMEYVALLDWAAAWNLRQLQLPDAMLQPALELDATKAYYYGLRPDADAALVKRLQQALDTLKRDGRYERMRQRCFR